MVLPRDDFQKNFIFGYFMPITDLILDNGSSVLLGNCMRAFGPPHPNPLPPKRVERE